MLGYKSMQTIPWRFFGNIHMTFFLLRTKNCYVIISAVPLRKENGGVLDFWNR